MSTYIIDFSDPLHQSIAIPPGGFDGPGGQVTSTSLRLYGRGALDWGESVDENLVRLNENFAGATAPQTPIGGQLWLRQVLYVKVGGTFYRWNFLTSAWNTITVTTTSNTISAHPVGSTVGSYVWSTTDQQLYRWDSIYKQAGVTWLPREVLTQASAPTTQKPQQDLLMYDTFHDDWIIAGGVSASAGLPVTGNSNGQLHFDTTTGKLYVWNLTDGIWHQILGPGMLTGAPVGGHNSVTHTNIDMQNTYRIFNVPTATNADLTAVANVDYVQGYTDTAVADALSTVSGNYVPKVGGSTMSGTYTLTGTLSVTGTVTGGSHTPASLTTAAATITAASVTTSLTMSSGATIQMGSNRVQGVANPVSGTDAVNKTSMDAAIATAINNADISGSVSIINPASSKAGDIKIEGGRIYIALSAGNWKCVWPPLYQ